MVGQGICDFVPIKDGLFKFVDQSESGSECDNDDYDLVSDHNQVTSAQGQLTTIVVEK